MPLPPSSSQLVAFVLCAFVCVGVLVVRVFRYHLLLLCKEAQSLSRSVCLFPLDLRPNHGHRVRPFESERKWAIESLPFLCSMTKGDRRDSEE